MENMDRPIVSTEKETMIKNLPNKSPGLDGFMGKCNETFRAGVPSLWEPMADGLRWICCSDNRNEAHTKRNVLEITPKPAPPHPSSPLKNRLPQKQSLVPKRLETTDKGNSLETS